MKKTISLMKRGYYSISASYRGKKSEGLVSFSEEDETKEDNPPENALVIISTVDIHDIHQVLVDIKSSMNVLFSSTYKQMGFDLATLGPSSGLIFSFFGEPEEQLGEISLPIELGDLEVLVVKLTTLLIIDDLGNLSLTYSELLYQRFIWR